MISIMPIWSRNAVISPEKFGFLSKFGFLGRVGASISVSFEILNRSLVLVPWSVFYPDHIYFITQERRYHRSFGCCEQYGSCSLRMLLLAWRPPLFMYILILVNINVYMNKTQALKP